MITVRVRPGNATKLLAICGIVAPHFCNSIVDGSGLTQASFDPDTQFGSELGVGDDTAAILANVTDILYGLLILAFAAGLHLGIGQRRGSIIGPGLLGAYGHLEDIPATESEWQVQPRRADLLAAILQKNFRLALLFRDLATLRTKEPILSPPDKLHWRGPRQSFVEMCGRLEAPKPVDRVVELAH